ncbi:hypothetical protein PG996_004627 [Apiospora saccharicola]|uniref:Uncharacterized protein n=1 Tax=Apiospora saccharicola TaxID=335842 RepID=A0ABR1W5Y1_9PEZI
MSQPRNIPNRSTGGDRVETPTTGRPSSRLPIPPPSSPVDHNIDDNNNNETAVGMSPMSHIASQGGGFKDAPTARHTLNLIAHRSLLYQQQLVRTYLRRAQTHSRAATSPGMAEAAAVFEQWQTTTLPQRRVPPPGPQRDPGPLKPRFEAVENVTPPMGMKKGLKPVGWLFGDRGVLKFLEAYLASAPRAKLGNLLVESTRGTAREEDWESVRYAALDSLVEPGQETMAGWTHEELWADRAWGNLPSYAHLRLLAWGWSPVAPRTLADKIGKLVEWLEEPESGSDGYSPCYAPDEWAELMAE